VPQVAKRKPSQRTYALDATMEAPSDREKVGPLHNYEPSTASRRAPTGDRGPCRIAQPEDGEPCLFGIFRTSPVTSFRHGVPIDVVAKLLTHRSSATTSSTYVHLDVADVRAALAKAGARGYQQEAGD
jgi:hypothetical protein